MSKRLKTGIAILNQFDTEAPDRIFNLLNDVSPDFAEHLIKNLGDVYRYFETSNKEKSKVKKVLAAV